MKHSLGASVGAIGRALKDNPRSRGAADPRRGRRQLPRLGRRGGCRARERIRPLHAGAPPRRIRQALGVSRAPLKKGRWPCSRRDSLQQGARYSLGADARRHRTLITKHERGLMGRASPTIVSGRPDRRQRDTANKIGTSGVASWRASTTSVLRRAPLATIDLSKTDGGHIPMRAQWREGTHVVHQVARGREEWTRPST